MGAIRITHRRVLVVAGLVGLAFIWVGLQSPARADGAAVAGKLALARTVVDTLSDSVGPGGGYGAQPNAGAVPFLGADPTKGLAGAFAELAGLSGFDNFTADNDDALSAITAKVQAIDDAIPGPDVLGDPVFDCNGSCAGQTLGAVTSITIALDITGSEPGQVNFTDLGLPSISFLPDGGKLDVQLDWAIHVDLVATDSGLRLGPRPTQHELAFGVRVTLPTAPFSVDLGALVVKATATTQPGFAGTITVNLDGAGVPAFGFENAGFNARWHLVTEDSPLMGVEADLDIAWPLSGPGVDTSDLTIKVENLTVDAAALLGDDLAEALSTIRKITHPIRTVTSPLLEPIPGLSDLTNLVGMGDSSMLSLMEFAGFNEDLRKILTKLFAIDDALTGLDGNGMLNLGSFELKGSDALTPQDLPLPAAATAALETILAACETPSGNVCEDAMNAFLEVANGGDTPGQDGFEFDFPVLEDPATLAGLVLGRDVDLFTFKTGPLGFEDEVDIPIVSVFIFSLRLHGPLEATVNLSGGFDTRGIKDALINSDPPDVPDLLNGLYLKNPGTADNPKPVVRLHSGIELELSALIADIGGGPVLDVYMSVPNSTPGGKLRPALVGGDIACALLEEDPIARANFSVRITATFDAIFDEWTDVLAEHTFLTEEDLCQTSASTIDVAELIDNTLMIKTATSRGVAPNEPDQVKVFMRHDPAGNPVKVVVTVNDNRFEEFDPASVASVVYDSTGDNRPVIFRAVATDGKPFEKKVDVRTGEGDDDVMLGVENYGFVFVNGGNDKVISLAGGAFIGGGPGNDYLSGGPEDDILGGGEGNDMIEGAGGPDNLFGGPDNDTLIDNSLDHNCLKGDAGDDALLSGEGADDLTGDTVMTAGLFSACVGVSPGPDPLTDGETGDGKDLIVTGGGEDLVVGGGGDEIVRMFGDTPADPTKPIYDAKVIAYGQGGNDSMSTGDGPDEIHGGPNDDSINAGDGDNHVHGGTGQDSIVAGGGTDDIFGDNGTDTCAPTPPNVPAETDADGAADNVQGGGGVDHIALEAGNDTANGGDGNDVICGHAGEDQIDGGGDDDDVFGGTGNDTPRGGAGSDDVFGNDGADNIFGDDADDRLVGGSWNATTADTGLQADGFGDHIHGNAGHDVITGDNALVTLPDLAVLLAETTVGQADLLFGDAGHDSLFGEHGADDLFGGEGDDHGEGGDGPDDLYGEAGNDDLVGGTAETADGASDGEGDQPDTADQLLGGDGHDILAGDNAAITRFGPFGAWTTDNLVDRPGTADDVLGLVRRRVTLLDLPTTTAPFAAIGFSGNDLLLGGNGHDVMYGQAGDDELQGGAQDDYIEGGAGNDFAYGQAGQDDIIGGTGRRVSDNPSSAASGRLDAAETLFGDDDPSLRPLSNTDDYDVVVGDNATVIRNDPFFTGVSGSGWAVNSFNSAIHRSLFLYDVGVVGTPALTGTFGSDTLWGQSADDRLYGQGGGDTLEGGDGDDYIEGNQGSDAIHGRNGNDDLVGGTGLINNDPPTGTNGRLEAAETISGGPGFDVIAGDNAIIRRVLSPSGAWLANTFNDGVQHERIQLVDMATLATPTVSTLVFGHDTIEGNEDDDLVYGQGGNDTMHGNDGDDYMEGNAGDDVMEGNADQDDMVGGTGRVNQDPATGGLGRFDGNDLMHGADATAGEGGDGGDDYDVMIGDNGVIERPLTPLPAGDWKVNTFNDGIERTITMLDLDLASAAPADSRVRGDDTMFGNGDDDLMRGQGANDTMHGNDGDDDMEGNGGIDRMFGDAQQDDILGGSRVAGRRDAGDFLYGGADHDTVLGDNALLVRPLTSLPAGDWQVQDYGHMFNDAVSTVDQHRVIRTITNLDVTIGLTSGSDVVHGQAGDDDLFGQLDDTGDSTGAVPVTENCDMGALNMPNDPYFTGEPTGAFTIAGDLVCGGVGEDAILGDQGTVNSFVEHGNQVVLTHNGAPFITETSRVENSLARQVVLEGITVGGADVLLGDDPTNRTANGVAPAGLGAHDSIHGGAGPDIINGHQGDDFLFGDDGSDAIWGGDQNDHSWGGYEGDFVDILPRTNEVAGTTTDDPITWFFFANDDPDTNDNPATQAREGYDGYRGFDIIYGGWGQDALQANEGDNGPVVGDRLVDWVGAYTAYYLCPATYGEFVSTRQLSPSLLLYLQQQAEADGATHVIGGPRTTDSGFDELALVYQKDTKSNANPAHPDTAGHFTCR